MVTPYFAQRKMPVGAGAAKMDWPSFYAGRESAAMAEFGRAFAGTGELAVERMNAITQTEYTAGKADFSTAIKEYENQMEQDPDIDSFAKKFNVFMGKAEKDILRGKSQAASKALTDYFKTQRGSLAEAVKKYAWERKKRVLWADTLTSVSKFERTGNAAKAEAALLEAVDTGVIAPDVAAERVMQIKRNVDWFEGLQIIERDPAKYIDMAEAEAESKKVEVGPKFEFLTNLNPEEKLRLLERARSDVAKLIDNREAEIKAEQERLMRLLRRKELTPDMVEESKLDVFGTGSKDTFFKMLDAQAEAIISEKKTPYTESDPVIEAAMLDRIRDPEEKVTSTEISELVGKGLSIDDASRMIDMLDVFKDDWFKRVDMYLKAQLGWDGAYEKFLHPEGGIAYKLASDKLFEAIESENLRGKDIYIKGSEIAIPFIVDYWEKALMMKSDKIERMSRLLEGKEPVDESLAIKGGWIPDDTRLYLEPPPLRGKIENWMSLPESKRKELWMKYEAGEELTVPTEQPKIEPEKPTREDARKNLDSLMRILE